MALGFVSVGAAPTPSLPSPIAPAAAPVASNGAQELVSNGFTTAQDFATQAFNNATQFMSELRSTSTQIAALPTITVDLPSLDGQIGDFVAPTQPVRPTADMNLPAAPSEPAIGNVSPLTVPDAPDFTAAPPSLNLPAAPAPLTASLPVAPELHAVTIPSSPDFELPEVPTLVGISVPTAPLLNLPVFRAVLPDSPLAPAYIFDFAEERYTSTLLTKLRTLLESWIDGQATGIPAAVEAAIWERARKRELAAATRKVLEQTRTFTRNGFTRPPGALAVGIDAALQESQDALISNSREVMIKQAEMEQSNRRFAIEQSWKVEEGLIQYTGQIATRALEAAKYAQQIGIDIYRETVAKYRAEIEAYVAHVEVFKAELQGELAKLDAFKAEIEAQRLIGTLNEQLVNVYRARIEGVKGIVEIFRAEVEAANTQALVNKTTIEAFAAQVGAYAELVRAKAAEYQGYATQVQAEVSRTEVFTAQAQAYAAQVQGYKAGVEAQAEGKRIELEIATRTPLEIFKARTEVFRNLAAAEGTRVDAIAKMYGADAAMFDSLVKGEIGRIEGQSAQLKAETDMAVASGNLRIEAAKANVEMLAQRVNLLIEAIRGGAQVAAQLAAAALSSVNLSAQVGDHVSNASSNSSSNSASVSAVAQASTVNSSSVSSSFSTSMQSSSIEQYTESDIRQEIYNYSN